MDPALRNKNLAKARRARIKALRKAKKQRQTEHKAAKQSYKAACANYYRIRREHGEGTPEEKKAFRKMIRAEVEWFRTFPGDGEVAHAA